MVFDAGPIPVDKSKWFLTQGYFKWFNAECTLLSLKFKFDYVRNFIQFNIFTCCIKYNILYTKRMVFERSCTRYI